LLAGKEGEIHERRGREKDEEERRNQKRTEEREVEDDSYGERKSIKFILDVCKETLHWIL
jgi:hypothetical protein